MRPFHCTTVGLTAAITPNVGDSGAQFMLVGDCVRAIPLYLKRKKKEKHNSTYWIDGFVLMAGSVGLGGGENRLAVLQTIICTLIVNV